MEQKEEVGHRTKKTERKKENKPDDTQSNTRAALRVHGGQKLMGDVHKQKLAAWNREINENLERKVGGCNGRREGVMKERTTCEGRR